MHGGGLTGLRTRTVRESFGPALPKGKKMTTKRCLSNKTPRCGSPWRVAVGMLLLAIANSGWADPAKCAKRNSIAWCILDAAGYSDGANDVSAKRAEDFLAKLTPQVHDGTSNNGAGALAIAGLEAAKLTTPTPGIGRGASVGMLLLGALIDGRRPGERVQMFMLMPESAVVDGDPGKTAEKAYVDALQRHLEADSVELVETPRKATFGATWTERHYRMTGGPRCGEVACIAGASFFSSDSTNKAPKAIEADPQWVGSSTVYVWDRIYAGARPFMRLETDERSVQRIAKEEYLRFIMHLPPWMFLYVPGDVGFLVTSDKVLPLAR